MDNGTLQFTKKNNTFVFKAVGVAIYDDCVLLHRSKYDNEWALPGGRVATAENSRNTLAREMHEELSVDIEVGRLLWIVENFYNNLSTDIQELGLYYLMEFDKDSYVCKQKNSIQGTEISDTSSATIPLIYEWHPIKSLNELSLKPTFLKNALSVLPYVPQHIIHVDNES